MGFENQNLSVITQMASRGIKIKDVMSYEGIEVDVVIFVQSLSANYLSSRESSECRCFAPYLDFFFFFRQRAEVRRKHPNSSVRRRERRPALEQQIKYEGRESGGKLGRK